MDVTAHIRAIDSAVETANARLSAPTHPRPSQDELDELAVLHRDRKEAVREMFVIDITLLEKHCSPGSSPIVDDDSTAAVVLMACLNPDAGKPSLLAWLAAHQSGPEAILAVVEYQIMRRLLPVPIYGLGALSVSEQIESLARVANALGTERLVRYTERRIEKLEFDLADVRRRSQRGRRSAEVVKQWQRQTEGLPRAITRHRSVLNQLDLDRLYASS